MPRYARLPNIAPARLDIDVYRGDTLTIRAKLKTHGVPIMLEGWSFRAYVKRGTETPDIITEFVVSVFNPLVGELRLALPADQSALLPPKSVWDLEAMDKSMRVRTILRGQITCMSDVTFDEPFMRGALRG